MIKEENRIYTIKQGDTLQSIADQLQINVDDIIEFHNRHSNIFYNRISSKPIWS